ncbi:programmed cell death protein 5 [Tetranychus urticae]|uniref:Programmed cell death protein 5 n=1 Tax=Tetranychus urticae TaxID=32264 RepID=T1L550_TETUR|nr:programmed cell death protein 5 [Tetranychus urticae]
MDDELEAIRARRLQELQQQHQGAKGPSGSGGDDGQARQERKEKEDEFRNTILSQILSQEARARLNTIKTAKPEKGKMLEDILINNARMGAISSKLSENDLKSILEKVSQQFNKETKVKFDRRRACIDSDDE